MPKLDLNEIQQQALEQALLKMKTGEGILKNNEKFKAFTEERKLIDDVAATKSPVVKEYIKLHKKAETKSYTHIGRMVRHMKIVVAEQEALKMAADFCTEAGDKKGLKQAAEDLNNHPAMLAYGKYLKGLRYLSGLDETVDKEIEAFFEEEMGITIDKSAEYDQWRKSKENSATTREAKLNQQFQKLVAPAKAREIYAKKCNESHHGICKQFLGIRALEGTKGIFGERMTPTLFCVAQMAKKGYSVEEITNPRLFREEKRKIGEEYMKHREANTKADEKWYMEEMYTGAEAMINTFHRYVKENKDEIKTEVDLALHGSELGVYTHLCYDMLQELDKMKKLYDKNFKTEKEVYDMAFKIGGYTFGEGTGSTDKIIYDITDNREPLMWCKEIQRQLYIKSFLDELKKDEPNLEAITGTPEQFLMIRDQIEAMPEYQDFFVPMDPTEENSEKQLDIKNLNSKKIKTLASMMSQQFLEDNNISLITPKVPVTVTSDPLKGEGCIIAEGSKIDRVVLKEGKQLIGTDMPGKMSEYLRGLGKKGMAGKAKDNSDQFNSMLRHYKETVDKLDATNVSKEDCLEEMKKLKKAASEYIKAKREQKGYLFKAIPDAKIDAQMLGKEKGGASIFTSRGRDRYEFALNIIERVATLEKKFGSLGKDMEAPQNEMEEDALGI